MKIKVQSIFGAEPLMCSANVKKRIHACGGSAVYGWLVRHGHLSDCLTSHVVWQDDEGELWDVTPQFVGLEGDIAVIDWPDDVEFIRDDAAVFDTVSLGTKHIPHDPTNRHVAKACEYMNIADRFLHGGEIDIEKCRYWTERANTELRRGGFGAYWDTPQSDTLKDYLKTGLPCTE